MKKAGTGIKRSDKPSNQHSPSKGGSFLSRHLPALRIALCLILMAEAQAFLPSLGAEPPVQRLVAVGDVHGAYDQFTALLRTFGLIDSENRWIGGSTILVQTGDVPDRGPGTRKVLDLLMDLEKQARRAGGAVHCLIGNHEAMNIYGDLRYTTPEEFASFRDGNSERMRDSFYRRHAREMKKPPDEAYRQEWYEKHPLGYFEHRIEFGPSGKYGKWITSHDSILKIDDTIFAHGGISPKYLDVPPDQINETIRQELRGEAKLEGGIAGDPLGPLWYRGLALDDEAAVGPHVDQLMKRYRARRIVVGHTTTRGAVMPRFGARVIMIDAGLSTVYGSAQSAFFIDRGNAFAMHRGHILEIPSDSGSLLLRYLEEAASFDPPPSPLRSLIDTLAAKLAAPAPLP